MKYIYNFQQAQFFITNGARVLGCGIGGKGDPYIQFEDNSFLQGLYTKWNSNKLDKSVTNKTN